MSEGVTHDYKRHGTTTLFAAPNVLNGAVLASCKPRHRHQEFLAFLREIDKAAPPELDIHCIADNYATHNHPKVKAWLAARSRWHMHFIPTYSSWLNQVERFFALITDKAIRRGSFTTHATPSAGQSPTAQAPALNPAEFDRQYAQALEQMRLMQAQTDQMRTTTDPQERQRLLQAHWASMQAAMAAMHGGCGGPAGG